MFVIPPPPAPPTRDERLAIGRMLALGAWSRLPAAVRHHARFDARVVGDDLRLLVDQDAVQSFARVTGETCLEPGRIEASLLDLVRLAGIPVPVAPVRA
jgi:hypothetical protein